jgi:hypothetical protein
MLNQNISTQSRIPAGLSSLREWDFNWRVVRQR